MENTQQSQVPVRSELPLNPEKRYLSLLFLVSSVAIITAILAGGIGYYLGTISRTEWLADNSQQNRSVQQPLIPEEKACTQEAKSCPDGSFVGRTGPNCEFAECAESSDVPQNEQFILKGYYKKYDGTQWEWGNEKVMCDSLVTTGGSQDLITEFRSIAESGNTLNKIIDGKFLININLSDLTPEDKLIIERSSVESPLEITVSKRQERGSGASTCYSLIDVVSVKSL